MSLCGIFVTVISSLGLAGDRMFYARELKTPIPAVSQPFFGFTHHYYTYTFIGKVTRSGAPCSGAIVRLKLTSPHGDQIREVKASVDGAYRASIVLYGEASESVEWELGITTADDVTRTVSGNYILMNGDWSQTIRKPIELTAI